MTEWQSGPPANASELKAAFDKGFAEAPQLDSSTKEDLLAIRLGTAHCALRLSEIRGVVADRKITRVPARHPALLGLASFRGAIVPAYDLHRLLDCPGVPAMRWLAIASAKPVALAFEAMDGHLRVSRDAVSPRIAGTTQHTFIHEFVRAQDMVRGIVDLGSVIDAVAKQVLRTG